MTFDYDLFVIGGGSGGVRCARIAASHGARVAIAEERYWGGTCVNVGCVPKKMMVQALEYAGFVADSHGFGWNTQPGEHDWATLIAAKDHEIKRLNGIYVKLLENSGVEWFAERAIFTGPNTLKLGEREITAETHRHCRRRPALHGPTSKAPNSASSLIRPSFPKPVPETRHTRWRRLLGNSQASSAALGPRLTCSTASVCRCVASTTTSANNLPAPQAQGITLHPSVLLHKLEQLADGTKRLHLTDGRTFDLDLVFFAVAQSKYRKSRPGSCRS